jgi:chitinase
MNRFTTAILFIILPSLACGAGPASVRTQIEPPVPPPASADIVIGYFPSWNRANFNHTMIAYENLTHIDIAFAWPDSEGNLIFPADFFYPELNGEAHRNGVKVLMSLGGWGNCDGFAPMAADPAKRAEFIRQTTEACRNHDFDGVDIDWEFVETPAEKENFTSLIGELSAALRAMEPPRLLTMAAPADDYYGQWIDYEALHPCFDFIGFMTYDYHGDWSDHSGHNAPLYSCGDACGSMDETFRYALSRGIPSSKILLGVPFYGRSFDCAHLYEAFHTSWECSYAEIVDLRADGWSYSWDACALVPFLTSPDGGTILSFDDGPSIRNKCRYILNNKAAGVIVWEISEDRREGKSILLEIIGDMLLRTFGKFPFPFPRHGERAWIESGNDR